MPDTSTFVHLITVAGVFGVAGTGVGYFAHELTHRRSLAREEHLRADRLRREAETIESMTTAAQQPIPWPETGNQYGMPPRPAYAPETARLFATASVPVPSSRAQFVDSDITGPVRHGAAPVSPSPLVNYSARLVYAPPRYDWTTRASAAGYTAVDLSPVPD